MASASCRITPQFNRARCALPEAKRFYERKRRQRHMMLAKKTLAHKLARACYRVLREEVPFERERLVAA